jgi:hypothetical protein
MDQLERGPQIVEIACGLFTRTLRRTVHAVQVARVGETLAIRTNDP